MFRLSRSINRGVQYPVVVGIEHLIADLIFTRECDVGAVLLIRSLMGEIFVREGEDDGRVLSLVKIAEWSRIGFCWWGLSVRVENDDGVEGFGFAFVYMEAIILASLRSG